MIKLITSLDLLADDVRIILKGRDRINSFLGGILTIMMIILTLFFAFLIGKDVIYKSSPFSYQQQIASKKYYNNTIDKKSFPLAFSLVDIANVPLPNFTKYFNIKLRYINLFYNEQGDLAKSIVDYIEMTKCKKEDFPTLTEEEFNSALLSNAFCPQFNSSSVYGFWSEPSIGYLSVIVSLCDYEELSNSCPSYTEIKDYMAQHFANIGIYALETQIAFSNFSDPIQKYVINPFKFFNSEMKIINYLIERDIVQTDSGFFLENILYEEFFRLKELQTDTAFFDNKSKIIMQIDFYSSNLSTIYFRRYIKVPEVLASTGGLFKLFMLIGYFLNLKFAKINKNLQIIHSLFKIESEFIGVKDNILNLNDQTNFKNIQMIEKIEPPVQPLEQTSKLNNFISHSKELENLKYIQGTQKENINPYNLIEKFKLIKKAKLKLKPNDYYSLICKKKNKPKNSTLYKIASKKIRKFIDLTFILNKLLEVDKIKFLFLQENQCKLLNMIKPLISEKKVKESENNQETEENVLISFFTNENYNEIDLKLLELLKNY